MRDSVPRLMVCLISIASLLFLSTGRLMKSLIMSRGSAYKPTPTKSVKKQLPMKLMNAMMKMMKLAEISSVESVEDWLTLLVAVDAVNVDEVRSTTGMST